MDRLRTSLFTVIGLVTFVITLAVAADMGYAAPAPSTANVNVVNTATNPVPVRDVANAKQPFHILASVTIPSTTESASTSFTVPAGKRLVIEFVSGYNTLATGQKLRAVNVLTWVSGQFNRHYVSILHGAPFNIGNEEFVISQPMKVYADGGPDTPVQVSFFREFAIGGPHTETTVLLTISGYLEDMP